jgi:serine/threonine-protein kinase
LTEDAESLAQRRVGCVLDDKWTLERLLGVGGMAAVYAAKHRNGARAAIKVLHPELSRLKEVRERFLREGYAANRVEHAGAVRVLDDDVVASGPEAGTAYIVMELLEGESLQERIEHPPPMSELEFLSIARSVLEVLEAAHARGVVHRDLKPENLFLVRAASNDGGPASGVKVKVLDFGLARLVQGQAITTYGLALGTPSFMSPEQAAGRIDEIDGRTDLFALAATGFRICAGRRIHEAGNPVDLVRKMASLAAPRVRSVRPDVSEACARVIDRALEFRREDRYESAAAMREDVDRAIAELDIGGPTQLAVPLPSPPESSSSSNRTTVDLRQRELPAPVLLADEESIRLPRRRSALPWLALLATAGGCGAWWLSHHRSPGSASTLAAAAPTNPPPSAPPATPAVASAQVPLVVRDRDAGVDAPDASTAAVSAASTAAVSAASTAAPHPALSPSKASPSLGPTTSATQHGAPGKVGPGNVHKFPRKHHGAKHHPGQNSGA